MVVLSIYVNPLQFGDVADLDAYPRDEARDLEIAEREGAALVFAPTREELQPRSGAGGPGVTVDPGPLGLVLEGADRPGHFRGVATVVVQLLDVIGPCSAYFGEKDAQQLAIVRRVVHELLLPVSVVGCPTVRDPDGVAVSSRNALLDPARREAAGCLFLGLSEAAQLARDGERESAVLVAAIAREVGATELAALDHAAIVDDATFEPVPTIDPTREHRAVVAARFGSVRLIDNLLLPRPR